MPTSTQRSNGGSASVTVADARSDATRSATPRSSLAPPPDNSVGRAVAGWLFPVYLMLILVGFPLLRIPGMTRSGNELNGFQAMFTAVNAATLTGFQQGAGVDSFLLPGQIVVFCLIVAGSMLSLIIGGMAAVRVLKLGYSDRRIAIGTGFAQVIMLAAGTLFLSFDTHRTIWSSLFLSAAAFGNCGMLVGSLPNAAGWQTHLVLLPMMTLGGLGLPVLLELWDRLFQRRLLSSHSRVALGMAAWLFVAGTLLLLVVRLVSTPLADESTNTFIEAIARSACLCVNARTTGLPWERLDQLSMATVPLLMLLIAIGGATAGAAGGIKTTTFFQLGRGLHQLWKGINPGRVMTVAAVTVGCYVLAVALASTLLLYALPERAPVQMIFNAFSAVSNCGLSFAAVEKSAAEYYILAGAMITGRLGSLTLLWWLADSTQQAEVAVA